MKRSKIFLGVQASIMREAEELDIDTTVANAPGGTEQASGANPNATVTTNQTPQDAGAEHGLSSDATRLPGNPDPEAKETPETLGSAAVPTVTEAAVTRNLSSIFAGNFVRVIERGTQKVVDRGIVAKVHNKVVTLEGNVDYAGEKYDFMKLA
jgi:hypothetical protein